jgi:hypothetical protein
MILLTRKVPGEWRLGWLWRGWASNMQASISVTGARSPLGGHTGPQSRSRDGYRFTRLSEKSR